MLHSHALLALACSLAPPTPAAPFPPAAQDESGGSFGDEEVYCRAGLAPRIPGTTDSQSGFTAPTPGNPDCDPGCTDISNTPDLAFGLAGGVYRVPVIFHVLNAYGGPQSAFAFGGLSDSYILAQLDALNRHFKTPIDTGIEFYLPTTVPGTSIPTTGIERHGVSVNAYYDLDDYTWRSFDPSRVVNIYTLGTVWGSGYAWTPNQPGVVGQQWDRIVVHRDLVGDIASMYPPKNPNGWIYDEGKVLVHEMGHYLGLDHTFHPSGWAPPYLCPTSGLCGTTGDMICDTAPQDEHSFFTDCDNPPAGTCAPPPYSNFMDWARDSCTTEFTYEQVLRMRCTLASCRKDLATTKPLAPVKVTTSEVLSEFVPVFDPLGDPTILAWNPAAGAASYELYFGTSPNFVGPTSGTALSFEPMHPFESTLLENTQYYWRVDSRNLTATTMGDLWSFTTKGGTIAIEVNGGGNETGEMHVQWEGAVGNNVEIRRWPDGSIFTVPNTGSWWDTSPPSGHNEYQVCQSNGNVCSSYVGP